MTFNQILDSLLVGVDTLKLQVDNLPPIEERSNLVESADNIELFALRLAGAFDQVRGLWEECDNARRYWANLAHYQYRRERQGRPVRQRHRARGWRARELQDFH